MHQQSSGGSSEQGQASRVLTRLMMSLTLGVLQVLGDYENVLAAFRHTS